MSPAAGLYARIFARNCAASTRRSSACGRRRRSIHRTRTWRDSLVDRKLWVCEWSSYQSDFEALGDDNSVRRRRRADCSASCCRFQPPSNLPPRRREIKARPLGRRSTSRDRPSARHGRIRIAYLSSQLRTHATAFLFVGVLERHDRSRFEIMVLNDAARDHSPMQSRVIDAVDSFVDVYELDDNRLIELDQGERDRHPDQSRSRRRDSPRRLFVAARAAASQLSQVGPGTAAAPNSDYFIADPIVIPPESRQWFAEKIVYLPDCYQPNNSKREIATRSISRARGRPSRRGVRLLLLQQQPQAQPRCVRRMDRASCRPRRAACCGLIQDSAAAIGNLRREAEARGVDPSRLVFAKKDRQRGTLGAPSAGRPVPRQLALRRPYDRERRAVGGVAGADARRRDVRQPRRVQPADGGRLCLSSSPPAAKPMSRMAIDLADESRPAQGAQGEARAQPRDGAAVRHRALRAPSRSGVRGDARATPRQSAARPHPNSRLTDAFTLASPASSAIARRAPAWRRLRSRPSPRSAPAIRAASAASPRRA